MTAQNATPRFVQLSQVLEQAKAKARTPIMRRQIKAISKNLTEWGDCVVYEDKVLRHVVASSISHRLGLAPRYVKDRLDQVHRIASYEAEENHG